LRTSRFHFFHRKQRKKGSKRNHRSRFASLGRSAKWHKGGSFQSNRFSSIEISMINGMTTLINAGSGLPLKKLMMGEKSSEN
jgi:hypothetical protein